MEAATKKTEAKPAMSAAPQPQKPNPPAKPAATPAPGSAGSASGPPNYPTPAPGGEAPGFFHIYKKGQGYWTRIGTVAGVALVGALTANFIWNERTYLGISSSGKGGYILVGVFALIYAIVAFYFLNKPSNVDFLIATDSEMKKVNWTSQRELVGSTRVVILFMFVVAVVLFVYDLFFSTVFWLIGVLKTPPPFIPGKH